MKKVKKQRKILRIVILFIIILIIVLVTAIAIYKYKNSYVSSYDDIIYDTTEREDINYPYRGYKFFQYYTGDISSDDIAKSMSNIAETVLPEYYLELKNASELEIEEFYNENTDEIIENLGINDVEKFVELIQYVCTLTADNLVFESYEVDYENFYNDDTFSYCYLYITYEGNEALPIKVAVRNEKSYLKYNMIYSVP